MATACSERHGRSAGNSTVLPQLPAALQLHVLSFLPANERALSGRLVSPDAAGALSQPQHCNASLSQPLPPHVAPWALEAGQQHVRQLPFRHKLQLLCTAAASGSEINLEVALRVLQPSVFPELLQNLHDQWHQKYVEHEADPGVAAVGAGHVEVLGWLLRSCPGLLEADDVREVAAQYCNLAALQAAWEALKGHTCYSTQPPAEYAARYLDAAARSTTPDALAKMEWLLAEGGGGCHLRDCTAAAAAPSGDLARLRWLCERGCAMHAERVLQAALEVANLAVAQWLVDEAGCQLPAAAGSNHRDWEPLLRVSARAPDGVAKVRWLQERGAPPLVTAGDDSLLQCVTVAATESGQVEVVRYLLSAFGRGAVGRMDLEVLTAAAAASSSVPLVELLRQAGLKFTGDSYIGAAGSGSLSMVRWLACEAGVSAAELSYEELADVIFDWPDDIAAHNRELLQAVQLLVGAGYSDWGIGAAKCLLTAAAARGNLALVQYLHGQLPQGYQLGRDAVTAAAEAGCEAVLEWLAEQHPGCLVGPGHSARCPYVCAAAAGDQGTLAALRRLGVPWGAQDVVVQAVNYSSTTPALRWLVGQGAPVGSVEDMGLAVRQPSPDGRPSRFTAEEQAWLRGLAAGAVRHGSTSQGAGRQPAATEQQEEEEGPRNG